MASKLDPSAVWRSFLVGFAGGVVAVPASAVTTGFVAWMTYDFLDDVGFTRRGAASAVQNVLQDGPRDAIRFWLDDVIQSGTAYARVMPVLVIVLGVISQGVALAVIGSTGRHRTVGDWIINGSDSIKRLLWRLPSLALAWWLPVLMLAFSARWIFVSLSGWTLVVGSMALAFVGAIALPRLLLVPAFVFRTDAPFGIRWINALWDSWIFTRGRLLHVWLAALLPTVAVLIAFAVVVGVAGNIIASIGDTVGLAAGAYSIRLALLVGVAAGAVCTAATVVAAAGYGFLLEERASCAYD